MTAPNYFVCGNKSIANIVKGSTTSVTTFGNHEYHSGLVVRFVVPPSFGMTEINNLTAEVIVTGSNTFVVPIFSVDFTDFIPILVPEAALQLAQVVAIAENALTLVCAEVNNKNILPETTGPIPINP